MIYDERITTTKKKKGGRVPNINNGSPWPWKLIRQRNENEKVKNKAMCGNRIERARYTDRNRRKTNIIYTGIYPGIHQYTHAHIYAYREGGIVDRKDGSIDDAIYNHCE